MESILVSKGINELNFLRAYAIVVLLLCHLPDYVNLGFLDWAHGYLVHVCLSIFVFISGYVLTLGSRISNVSELRSYLIRKIKRIYVLYIPALAIFLVVFDHEYELSYLLFIDHFLAMQLIFASEIRPYFTLWYVGLIIPYYFAFGLADYLSSVLARGRLFRCFRPSVIVILMALVPLLCILVYTFEMDSRLVLYLPSFLAGIYFGARGELSSDNRVELSGSFLLPLLLSIGLLITSFVCLIGTNHEFFVVAIKSILIAFIPVSHMIVTQTAVPANLMANKAIEYISFSSFAVYLFHRPILEGAQTIFSRWEISNVALLLSLYLGAVIPFVLFPIAIKTQNIAANWLKK